MANSLISAYGAGKRAGRAEPDIEVINGHKYLKTPVCPFPLRRFISFFLWHEGLYNGTMQRLTQNL